MMALAAALIQIFLLYFACITAVKFTASLLGALFAVGLPATKGTTQIIPAGIARMSAPVRFDTIAVGIEKKIESEL
jgi:hypothetical protein